MWAEILFLVICGPMSHLMDEAEECSREKHVMFFVYITTCNYLNNSMFKKQSIKV